MKKTISIFVLGAAFFLGTLATEAQNRKEYKAKAKKELLKLDKQLQLDQKQEEIIYRAFVAREINSGHLKEGKEMTPEMKANKRKYQISLWKTMHRTLSPEQFEKYKKIEMENMTDEELRFMKKMEKKMEKPRSQALRN